MDLSINVELNLGSVLTKEGEVGKRADYAIQAAMFILEDEYVKQAPADRGAAGFKGGIQVKRNGYLDYVVESTARDKGRNYPLYLFQGTGRMKGKPDFGYTTGHVRAGTVAYGIGGIRPNKAAKRAKDNKQKAFIEFITKKIDLK